MRPEHAGRDFVRAELSAWPRPRPDGASADCAGRGVALLAGVSVDYSTRLEQGRALDVSESVLTALGRALHSTTPRWGT